MKKICLGLLVLLSSCATLGVKENAKIVEFIKNPKKNIQTLPATFTAEYPITDPIKVRVYWSVGANTNQQSLYREINDKIYTVKNPTFPDSLPMNSLFSPLFSEGLYRIVGYKGVAGSGFNEKGDTREPMHSTKFTVVVGAYRIDFAHFTHPDGTIRIYSYDGLAEKLTNFELFFSDTIPNREALILEISTSTKKYPYVVIGQRVH